MAKRAKWYLMLLIIVERSIHIIKYLDEQSDRLEKASEESFFQKERWNTFLSSSWLFCNDHSSMSWNSAELNREEWGWYKSKLT